MSDRTVDDRDVRGYCPMGCGETLMLGAGGFITCTHSRCDRPDAAHLVLQEKEHRHIVNFDRQGWTITHPLLDRVLFDSLNDCPLVDHLRSLDHSPVEPGRYAAIPDGTSWAFIPQDGEVHRIALKDPSPDLDEFLVDTPEDGAAEEKAWVRRDLVDSAEAAVAFLNVRLPLDDPTFEYAADGSTSWHKPSGTPTGDGEWWVSDEDDEERWRSEWCPWGDCEADEEGAVEFWNVEVVEPDA